MPDEVLLAEDNYLAAWRLLASAASGGAVVETDDLLFTCAPVPVQQFNCAFVKPQVDPADCVESAKAFFAGRKTPFTFRFRAEDGFEPDRALTSAGLVSAGSSPLMVALSTHIDGVSDVEIRQVDAVSWPAHISTMAHGFGMPLDLLRTVVPSTLATSRDYAAFNAYLDGSVVSTSALVVSDGVAGVYNVATSEAYRGRGLGGATTRAAVAEGLRRGCAYTTLQASEMGYRLYAQMGYRTVIRWCHYTGT